jgi:adenylate cyclase
VPPSADEVRAELSRILASSGFANADRMATFLRYVVEKTLAGESEQIKEYAIGVDVFGRDADYDPRLDSIVRVEARRLRSKLDEYYGGDGRDDEVVIRLRRGGYAPTFERKVTEPGVPATAPPAVPARIRRPFLRFGLAFALGALAMAWFVWRATPSNRTAPPPPAAPTVSIAVLPFSHYSSNADDAFLAARLTDGVTSELARLGTLRVVSHTSVMQFVETRSPTTDVGKALNADVLMEGTLARTGGNVDVSIRLVSGRSNYKLWVENFSGPSSEPADLARRIAARIGPAALAPAKR